MAAPGPWLEELEAMRQQVARLRRDLADALAGFGAPGPLLSLRRHKGMFSLLPLPADGMTRLRQEFGIYGTQAGRITIAGLRPDQMKPALVFC